MQGLFIQSLQRTLKEVHMSAIVIDGKKIAETFKSKARDTILKLRENEKLNPRLAVVVVGSDPASQVYVRQKERACKEVGLNSRVVRLPDTCTQNQLAHAISSQADDPSVVGVLVQLPLPDHIDEEEALSHIPAYKDVDGFSHINVGRIWKGEKAKHCACTPLGIVNMFDEIGVNLSGKHVVIVGRSNTVGKPLAALCLKRDATVTVCHSKTQNLKEITKQADVLVAAVGKPKLITADMVKKNAVVVDVGINRTPKLDENGDETGETKLVGDVDFHAVKEVASYITPVPGGVGPLTVAQLMVNASQAALAQRLLLLHEKEREEAKQWVKSLSQETNTETITPYLKN